MTSNIILCSQFMGSFKSISCQNVVIDLMVVLPFGQLQMIEEKMQKQIDKLLTSDMAGAEEEKSNSKVRCHTHSFRHII